MITNLSRSFFGVVYKKNKQLFVFFIGILLYIGVAGYKRINISPFLLWDVYSFPIKADTQTVYSTIYNGQLYYKPWIWDHHKRIMSVYTVPWYAACVANGYKDILEQGGAHFIKKYKVVPDRAVKKLYNSSDEIKQYPEWYKRYISANTGDTIRTLQIYAVTLAYDKVSNNVHVVSKQLLVNE